MKLQPHLVLLLLGAFMVGTCTCAIDTNRAIGDDYGIGALNRSSFPAGFIFGAGSASYQYEGAVREDGRGPSIWDTFTHKYPEKIKDHSNGDVAVDSYHRYKEDVKIVKDMGLDAYRFSLAWPRILPHGKLNMGVNEKGLAYYHNLIDELLANGITPFVTLFHWDLPQALEDAYGGFLSTKIVDDFKDYADLCFKEFGGKVKHWMTLNEPTLYASGGYADGQKAPGRCSKWMNRNCTGGDSATEPYLVNQNMLLAHAAAVELYRSTYKASQKGVIGIALVSHWFIPLSPALRHQNAAIRALDFMFGWFMDPIAKGEYPHSMQSLVGERLLKFSPEQRKLVKGSFDFLGLNYYAAFYAAYAANLKGAKPSYLTDSLVKQVAERNGIPIGPKAASEWLHVYPKGLRDLLHHIRKNYDNPEVYIVENGVDEANNDTLSLEEALYDPMRVKYYHDHLAFLKLAIKEGVNVKGYFAWSLLDNFEWAAGFTTRFGINYVDYKNDLKRYPKLSSHWFKKFMQRTN